jgi:hypothetical protein
VFFINYTGAPAPVWAGLAIDFSQSILLTMANSIKKNWYRNLLTLVCMAFFLTTGSGFAPGPMKGYTPWQAPVVSIVEIKESGITFSLEKTEGVEYRVRYIRMENNQSSENYTISGTTVNFNALPSGTYRFIFTAISIYGSDYVIIDDIMM